MREERGSVTPLVIGFFLVLAMAVVVVTDASAAYLQRSGLDTVADGAALFAAEGLTGEDVYHQGLDGPLVPGEEAARVEVARYLRDTGAAERFPGLTWDLEVRDDRVVVRVQAPLELPLTLPGVADTATIRSTGSALVLVD